MNPYYRVACVGYSSAETRRFSSRGAQQRRMFRFVPIADVSELNSLAPRRRFDAVLIASSDFAACPPGTLTLRSKDDSMLPIFIAGARIPKVSDKEKCEPAIYISFNETPVESAAFRLCTENVLHRKRVSDYNPSEYHRSFCQELCFQKILDGCSDSILVTDIEGNVIYANAVAGQLLDHRSTELVGKRICFLSGEAQATTYALQRSSGDNLHIEITTRLSLDDDPPVLIHTIRDVTEKTARQSAEIASEISRHQEDKWQSLETLATGVSHQFNNLLMIILGHCSRMKAMTGIESNLIESIVQIEKSTTRAADITSQLLTFAGVGKFGFEIISLSEIIDRLHYLFDAIASRKATIEYNLDMEIPKVNGDPTQLQRLLFDVINNAIESFQNEKGVISVTTGWIDFKSDQLGSGSFTDNLPAGKYIYIQVSDTGCGMEEEVIRQIYQPFYTTKETQKGLGLSTALGIVRVHHGAMGVHSLVGRGTTVEVFLPAVESPSTIESVQNEFRRSQVPFNRSLRLLLAEDESDLRDVVREYFTAGGCQVTAAEDGCDCVEKYREMQGNFDCIILDMSMPNMDGEETIAALRSLGSDAPVIVTSGYTDYNTIARLKASGVAFLQKPYQLTVLDDLIRGQIADYLTLQPEMAN